MTTIAEYLDGLRGGRDTLLVVDPIGLPWPEDFCRVDPEKLAQEILVRDSLPLENCPVLVVGRDPAPTETEMLARSTVAHADPRSRIFWPAGSLPQNALRRCDLVVEVQSPTRVLVLKNRWGTHGETVEFEPPEPSSWKEPTPSP